MLKKFPSIHLCSSWKPATCTEIVHVGIPKEPEVFLADAVKAGHPRDFVARAPKLMREVLSRFVVEPVANRFQRRANFFKKWLKRSLELKQEEEELHSSLKPHLQQLMGGKRLLLWKEILIDLEYKDAKIIDEMIEGFPLTGWAKRSDVFEPSVRRPDFTLDQLARMSPGLNSSVVKSLETQEWSSIDDQVWKDTLDELSRGWLSEEKPQQLKFVAKRFGLQQKSKVRMIDDFSVCGVNGAFGLREKLRVQAVDELTSYLAILLDESQTESPPKLVGRTFDLKSAYKQFGVDDFHSHHCFVGVKNPKGGVSQLAVKALPFGATGSVAAFLRISACVCYIGVRALDLIWTAYFDDFTAVCSEEEAINVEFYVTSLFKLLGLSYASEGDKAPPFGTSFTSLGLVFDLSNFPSGSFRLRHTDGRKSELLQSTLDLSKLNTCDSKILERLHGRLVWFGSFVFGRQLNLHLKCVNRYATKKARNVRLDEDLLVALQGVRKHLESSIPVQISRACCSTWLIFSDGAYEPKAKVVASIGAVLVNPSGEVIEFFGEAVPDTLVSELLEKSQHPIYELEVLPVILATSLWAPFIYGSQTVYYIDNEAARSAFVQGTGSTQATKCFINAFDNMETKLNILAWFGRVPSHSNLADLPSRLQFDHPLLSFATKKSVVVPAHIYEVGLAAGVTETRPFADVSPLSAEKEVPQNSI